MNTKHLSRELLCVSLLSFAYCGCNDSAESANTGNAAEGGKSAQGASSGGARSSATSTGAATPAAGGNGNANSATQSTLGGTTASTSTSVAASALGGSPGNGGAITKPTAGGAPGTTSPKATGGMRNVSGAPGITASVSGSSSTAPIGLPSSGAPSNGGAAANPRAGAAGRGGRAGGPPTNDNVGGAAGGSKPAATAGNSSTTVPNNGTCTASKAANSNVTGTGPHKVTVETNADPGINEGTIYRPSDLGGTEKYPIFVWGEGGCSQNGSSNSLAMGEIASQGYFVIADGTPGGSSSRSMDSSDVTSMGKPLLAYISWAIAENSKPCSAYYQSLDTTKIASNGFSCGGLMAEGTAGDSRITTWGITSSGMFSANQAFYKTIHTPVLIVLGGSSDMAYENGMRDYDNISALGIPIMLFSKDIGHGGDLSKKGGDFNKINLAWLNWQLKGDETAAGKGLLVGSGCSYCKDSAWEVKSKNIE